MPPVFIILDPQNDFFGSDNPNLTAFLETVPVINHTIAFFHQHHWPVILLQHISTGKPEGSKQWEVYEKFECLPEDIFIAKDKQNAFEGSPLQKILETRRASQLLLAGYLAEYCVLTTYRAAILLGYPTFILKDGTASLDCSKTLEEVVSNIRFIDQAEVEAVFCSAHH